MLESHKPEVIAKYSWLIEEVERIKLILTSTEIKPFTYKPTGRRNSIRAYNLSKIVEDRLHNGFKSINNSIDGRH